MWGTKLKDKKNLVIYVLTTALFFLGLSSINTANGATKVKTIYYVSTGQYGCGSGVQVGGGFFDTGYGSLIRCSIRVSG
jgi:hypothetical protein